MKSKNGIMKRQYVKGFGDFLNESESMSSDMDEMGIDIFKNEMESRLLEMVDLVDSYLLDKGETCETSTKVCIKNKILELSGYIGSIKFEDLKDGEFTETDYEIGLETPY